MNLGGVVHLNKTGFCIICGVLLLFLLYVSTNNNQSNETIKKPINLKQLLKVSLKAAENGGLEVVATKDNLKIKSKGLTKEGLIDSVTTADFLSHCAIVQTIKNSFSTINIVSEEAKTSCDNNQKVDLSENNLEVIEKLPDRWIQEDDITIWIDPLDATFEYTEKLYQYVTTMVCVAVRGEPVIGVIHKPFSKETSWAWVGQFRSDDLISVVPQPDNGKVKLIISRSHSGDIKEVLEKKLKNYELIVAAGAGYKALEVATGKADAYLHTTLIKKWDICAGNAIINALSGKMTSKNDKSINYSDLSNVKEDGLVASLTNHTYYLQLLSN